MNTFQNENEETEVDTTDVEEPSPSCPDCKAIMLRKGSCFKCLNCGKSISIRLGTALLAKLSAEEEVPSCPGCGATMLRQGSGWQCLNCGEFV